LINVHSIMRTLITPDYMTALTGWRFWKIRRTSKDGNLWLRSVVRNELWPPMERLEARSSFYQDSSTIIIPGARSANGIYAYKTASDALENIDHYCYRGTFLGKVSLWGVIQKHHFGYRSQFAYPLSLVSGICCVCKRIVNLKSEPFAIGWASLHFTEDFSVSGFLCEECNEKYYSVDMESSHRELAELVDRYCIGIE
jgi:hypothetical protein